jgi:hypothetical protein
MGLFELLKRKQPVEEDSENLALVTLVIRGVNNKSLRPEVLQRILDSELVFVLPIESISSETDTIPPNTSFEIARIATGHVSLFTSNARVRETSFDLSKFGYSSAPGRDIIPLLQNQKIAIDPFSIHGIELEFALEAESSSPTLNLRDYKLLFGEQLKIAFRAIPAIRSAKISFIKDPEKGGRTVLVIGIYSDSRIRPIFKKVLKSVRTTLGKGQLVRMVDFGDPRSHQFFDPESELYYRKWGDSDS